ncbi:MAG: efflux RND transporter periplasmic adaptor subunit [Bacteroidales bacterium]|nr:efflux RND transporter periplasmic adaptor subunit [Bacteroidales bacterium]
MKKIFNKRIFQLSLGLLAGFFFGWLIFGGDKVVQHDHTENVVQTTWTCSMHPQIRQAAPGQCPICGMDLIQVSKNKASAKNNSPFIYSMTPQAVALANVQTAQVRLSSAEHEIYLTGKVAVNEQLRAVITANYSGRIEKLFVDFTGQTVNKGHKLVTIYSPELVTAQKELLEAAKNKNMNPILYNAVREKLSLWKLSENQIKTIEASGNVLTEFDVYADISGVVIRREVSTGDYVNKGSVLFEIADLGSVWILLDAYESDIPWLKLGEKISFTLSSIPGKEYNSSITFIDPMINPNTRTVSVRAEASNQGMTLKPEMFVTARIKSKHPKGDKSLIIPKTAILWTGKRSVIYVKIPDSEFPAYEMREVTLGAPSGNFYVIESGLRVGEEIVINGVFSIDAAAQLSGNFSMMNRPVSKRASVPDRFKSQLTDLVSQFFALKNSLVASDISGAKKSAKGVLNSLQSVDMKLLDADAHNIWMERANPLRMTLELLLKTDNLVGYRKQFSAFSDILLEVTDIFGLSIETVYVAYCPMAFDDKGAFWLSEFEEIKNPYFGNAMLKCGEVKKKIRSVESFQETTVKKQAEGHQH